MRLQKFLSNIGFCSRSDAERFIAAGRVVVDGKKAVIGDKVSGAEAIFVDGQRVLDAKALTVKVIAFHKPEGVECTLSVSQHAQTLHDFDFGPDRVFPIGGLDGDSCGLLLLTNDGDLGHRLARPGVGHADEYALTFAREPAADVLERLKRGLKGGEMEVVARDIRLQGKSMRCVLHQGRSKLLRRLCKMAGLEVSQVQRIGIGPVRLDDLAAGQWRLLTEDEVRKLRQAAGATGRRRIVSPRGR